MPPYASDPKTAAAAAVALAAEDCVGAECNRCVACTAQFLRDTTKACKHRRPAALRQRRSPTVNNWSSAASHNTRTQQDGKQGKA